MKMQEYFEQHREQIHSEAAAAELPEQIVRSLGNHLDRMLLLHNEDCDSQQVLETAAWLIEMSKASLGLLACSGECIIWERKGKGSVPAARDDRRGGLLSSLTGIGGNPRRERLHGLPLALFILSLGGGAVFMLSAILPLLSGQSGVSHAPHLPWTLLFCVLGCALMFFAGRLFTTGGGTPAGGESSTPTIEAQVTYDPEKICRCMKTMVLTMDSILSQAALPADSSGSSPGSANGAGHMAPGAGGSAGLPEEELELYSALLESIYSRDAQSMDDMLSDLRYYLHHRGIDLAEYDQEHAQWFETMPSRSQQTFRPALVSGSMLLKKGLAGISEPGSA